jgi:hypothetical protein
MKEVDDHGREGESTRWFFFIPDFVEIQKKVFPICRGRHYKEFQRMGPIRAGAGEVKFYFIQPVSFSPSRLLD